MTRISLRLSRLATLIVLSACGTEYRQSSLSPTTDFAETIHGLYTSVFWWSVLILAVVWVVLGYVLVRYRARPGAPLPKQTHGHLGLEVAWTLGPALIVVAIAVPTIQAVFETQRGDPENAYIVEVVGHQFWWEFRYPEGVVTANELHLPVGRPVSLRLHSADVIHSFWVPQLGGKRDLNPLVQRPDGEMPRYNWLHFTILEPGVYLGQCAEFCGLSHSLMGTRVIARPEAEFQEWLAAWNGGSAADTTAAPPAAAAAPVEPPPSPPDTAPTGVPQTSAATPPPGTGGPVTADPPDTATAPAAGAPGPASPQDAAEQGEEIFHRSTCIACHAIQGTMAQGVLGPNLTLFGRRTTLGAGWLENDEDNLVRWIVSPGSIKPGVLMPGTGEPGGNWPATGLSEEQVRQVAAYLLSLR
jgi:cytochrome c oxidase subunit 2